VSDVFKARQVHPRFGRITGTLQGARQAEFGRWVRGVKANRLSIFVGCLGELLTLEITRAEKIVCVG